MFETEVESWLDVILSKLVEGITGNQTKRKLKKRDC